MANNDTEIGISLKTDASEASKDIDKLNSSLDRTQQILDAYKPYLDMFNKLTLGIKRMADVNTKRMNDNLNITSEYFKKFNKSMETISTSKFASNLNTVQNALDGFNKQIRNVSKLSLKMPSLTGLDFSPLNNVDTSKIIQLASSFEKMRNAQIDKTSRSVLNLVNSMERMGTLNFNPNMTGNIQSQMSASAETLKQFMDKLQGFNFDGFSRLATDIAKVPKAMKQMESLQMKKIGKVFTTLTKQILPFIEHLKEASAEILALSNLTSAINKFNGGMKRVKQTTKETGTEAEKAGNHFNNMFTVGKIYAFFNQAKHYSSGFLNMLNKSIDFTEIENYFSRAMSNMRDEAMKFQNTLSESFGMAMPDMMKAQATFKNMLGSLGGLSQQMTYELSERVTKMVLDYSSLYNTTIDSAITKFQAALSKQVRPIRSTSGYDITQNVLESTAEMIGITDRSIQQMNEMEKRLLIILTLQSQMARSMAMGDFARTIEQPANQLRVLQQQLSEVGRWISAVFYGVIAQVLPYINGFLMAIKEVIKTLAFFLGYEMPDSGGASGTIIDQMGDSMEDFGSSVGDANSGLDGTKDKLKEIEGQLAGFDQLEVIKQPSDSGSTGGSGGSAGSGMTVDPRLLEALNKWKYTFDDIHMRANDIRDTLLEWLNILGKGIQENIFEPIQNSWNKYGSPIIENVKSAFNNIGYVASNAFDIVTVKWKPFFQQASDLFFSLLETSSIVFDGITKFIKGVWDAGGKYLFEGIFDLSTAFLKVATSINNNFVKPLLKWFNNSILPVISGFVGVVLGLIGKLLSGLGTITRWVADCEPLVIGLATAFTTLFVSVKAYEFVKLFSTLKSHLGTLGALNSLLIQHSDLYRKLWVVINNGKNNLLSLKDSYSSLNTILSNTKIWTTVSGYINNASGSLLNLGDTMIEFGDTMIEGGGKISSFAGVLVGKLGSALAWLSANPLVALASAIGIVVGAIVLFSTSQQNATKDISDCSEEIQKQYEDFKNLSTSVDDVKDSMDKQISSTKIQTGLASDYIDMLREMSNEDGYVKNSDKAKYLIEEINKILPDTVKWTEDGRVAWEKTPEEIQKTINKTIQLAEVQAYQEGYVETLKSSIEQQRIMRGEQDKLNQMYDDAKTSYARYVEEYDKGNHRMGEAKITYDEWIRTLENGDTQLSEQKILLESMEAEQAKNNETLGFYKDGLYASTEALGQYNSVLFSTSEELRLLDEAQRKELDTLAGSLSGSLTLYQEYTSGLVEADATQLESTKTTIGSIIEQYGAKAVAFGLSYVDMKNVLDEQGIALNEEELAQLETSITNAENSNAQKLENFKKNKEETMTELKRHNSEMTTQEEKEYEILLDKLNEFGIDVSYEKRAQYESMMRAMRDNGIKVNSEQGEQYVQFISALKRQGVNVENEQTLQHVARMIKSAKNGEAEGLRFLEMMKKSVDSDSIDPEIEKMLKDASKVIDENEPSVNVKAETSDAMKAYNKVATNRSSTLTINPVLSKNGIKVGESTLAFKMYANGGFPNVGQMFIAREAGPELVGTMGGRSVVANNDQIIQGVSGGVFSAVVDAFKVIGGMNRKQDIYLTNYTIVDGKIVRKEVKKADDEHIAKTGKRLFTR